MVKARVLASLCLAMTSFMGSVAAGQSVFEFDRWMQKIERRTLSAQRHLKRSEVEEAIADTREVQALYERMADYFARRGNPDAEKISRTGIDLAARIIRSAAARDFAGAQRSATALAKDCRQCHADHKPLD